MGARSEWIYGRHPVAEALRTGRRRFFEIRLAEGTATKGLLGAILQRAQQGGIPVRRVPRGVLDSLAENHQGVAARVAPYPYADLGEILQRAAHAARRRLLVLDRIQDPRNLGAVLRTAEGMGVQGVILAQRGAAGVTPVAVRASAGASEHLLIARANIAQALRRLKGRGFWIYGLALDPGAKPLPQVRAAEATALVVGSEGAGMRRLVRESCDLLISIPMRGLVASLNASVAASIAMYALWGRGDEEA
jgi:23S rRNA (guanosine2251-2'-O)-methyltransferase